MEHSESCSRTAERDLLKETTTPMRPRRTRRFERRSTQGKDSKVLTRTMGAPLTKVGTCEMEMKVAISGSEQGKGYWTPLSNPAKQAGSSNPVDGVVKRSQASWYAQTKL